MTKPHISICPEGAAAIGFTAFTALLCSILDWEIPAILFWILCWFSLHFFRDPDRVVPQAKGLAVSPADGKVLSIEKKPDPISGQELVRVSVFMNIFNVHVNRAPVACTVEDIVYFGGKFFNASLDKASTDNERCAWLLRGRDGSAWTMVQIAGLVARRIVCRAGIGDELARGERVGMIRFGSRVDLYLPAGYSPAVGAGDRVFAGETVIARAD